MKRKTNLTKKRRTIIAITKGGKKEHKKDKATIK